MPTPTSPTPTPMEIIVEPDGDARCIYAEDIDLAALGEVGVVRASHVEPDHDGQWWADLSPVSGPNLGPFDRRSDALAAEISWLRTHWLNTPIHGFLNFKHGDTTYAPNPPARRCSLASATTSLPSSAD